MSADHYRTLAAPAEHRIKIERSEFLGLAFPIAGDVEFFPELERIEKKYFDATHHCWAFRLFADSRARSSDAGEPSGTAGKPILAALEGAELFDLGVVVVRWYGGIKLGTGGLSRAYRESASSTLAGAALLDRYVYRRFRVVVPFEQLSTVYRLVDPPHVVLIGETYGERNVFELDVRAGRGEDFAKVLSEKRLTTLP